MPPDTRARGCSYTLSPLAAAAAQAKDKGGLMADLLGTKGFLGKKLSTQSRGFANEREARGVNAKVAEAEAKWETKREEFKQRKISSFMESPKISIHTQALRGMGAQRN